MSFEDWLLAHGLYFDRDILGFSNRFDVYIGVNPDPKCLRAVELCEKFQFEVVVHYELHPDFPTECPVIYLNDVLIGDFETMLETAKIERPARAYVRKPRIG